MKLKYSNKKGYKISNITEAELYNLDITLAKIIVAYLKEFKKTITGVHSPYIVLEIDNKITETNINFDASLKLYKEEVDACINFFEKYINDDDNIENVNEEWERFIKLFYSLWR